MEALTSPVRAVQAVEDVIKTLPQLDIETRHYLAGGVYEREILVPAGSMITGKIHLTEHLAKLVKGVLGIYSEDQHGIIEGPCTFISKPGVKRLGYAHTDVVFSTFHYVGNERDIEKIEKMLVVDTMEEYLEYSGKTPGKLREINIGDSDPPIFPYIKMEEK